MDEKAITTRRHGRAGTGQAGHSRRAVLRGSAVGACAVGTSALLASCSEGSDGPGASDGGSDSRPDRGRPGPGDDAAPPAAPAPERAVRALVTELEDHSGLVRDLATVDLSARLEKAVSYPRPAGARGIAEAVDVAVAKILRETRMRSASSLTITSKTVVCGAAVLGVLLDVADDEGSSTCLLWYRADGDRALTSPALITGERWGDLAEALRGATQELKGVDVDGLAEQLREQPRPWGNGPAILPAADGALRLLFPAAPFGDRHREALVQIGTEAASGMLSEFGEQVRAAVADPVEFDPEQVTTPDPDHRRGERAYERPEHASPGLPARTTAGPGPRTQLAPLTAPGTAPSAVAAPDAGRLRSVALTFDDGPSPELNETLRGHLAEHGAVATFFMIGSSVHGAARACAATAADGHEIGGHSWSHPDLSKVGPDRLESEIDRTTREIQEVTGRAPFHMRPPYGADSPRVDRQAGVNQQSVQLWNVDSLDWRHRDPRKNFAEVTGLCSRGAIILMHEIHEPSVATVPRLLEWFAQEGYTLLTCSELGQNQMHAGKTYRHGPCDQEGSSGVAGEQSPAT